MLEKSSFLFWKKGREKRQIFVFWNEIAAIVSIHFFFNSSKQSIEELNLRIFEFSA